MGSPMTKNGLLFFNKKMDAHSASSGNDSVMSEAVEYQFLDDDDLKFNQAIEEDKNLGSMSKFGDI